MSCVYVGQLFIAEIRTHHGDWSDFTKKVGGKIMPRLEAIQVIKSLCKTSGNFPTAAVDKPEQIWADKSHFACSNLARMQLEH